MFYNINNQNEYLTFNEAMMCNIGSANGVHYPDSLPTFNRMEMFLDQELSSRSSVIIQQMIGSEISLDLMYTIAEAAFNFPIKMQILDEGVFALELFWGPTLSVSDFGARIMAGILGSMVKEPTTVIMATSGDGGAAVAHAFHKFPNINVVILYPHQQIPDIQEKMFCTLGDNIQTFAVNGNINDCHTLVKKCLTDNTIKTPTTSANSINISEVFTQSCYYFEAMAQILPEKDKETIFSVPCGNFGNLMGGLFARAVGLPIKKFVAATNINDTVARYSDTSIWNPQPMKKTISNAMNITHPSNWPRIEEIMLKQSWNFQDVVRTIAVDDDTTKKAMLELKDLDYIAEPHSAIAYHGLKSELKEKQNGIFLCNTHPAKYKTIVEEIVGLEVSLPKEIQAVMDKPVLSTVIPNDYQTLKEAMDTAGALCC